MRPGKALEAIISWGMRLYVLAYYMALYPWQINKITCFAYNIPIRKHTARVLMVTTHGLQMFVGRTVIMWSFGFYLIWTPAAS